MVIEVVFMRQKSDQLLRLLTEQGIEPLTWYERLPDAIELWHWQQAAERLWRDAAKRQAAQTREPVPTRGSVQWEVFLCLRETQPGDLLDNAFVEEVVGLARRYGLGASVYVVVDVSFDVGNSDLPGQADYWQTWFADVYGAGATDVIQARLKPDSPTPAYLDSEILNGLRIGAARSQARHQRLNPGGLWRCLCRRETGIFLKPFLKSYPVLTEAKTNALPGNLVTVMDKSAVDTKSEREQAKLLNQALLACPSGKHLVARAHPTLLSNYVEGLDQQRLDIVDYCGVFELRYLFQLLNHDDYALGLPKNMREQGLASSAPRVLQPPPAAPPAMPTLLITSSFDPDGPAGWQHLQAVAHEIGEVTRLKPPHARWLVHLGVTAENLPALLEQLPKELTVWLHLGHGKAAGLQEAESGEFLEPERWLNCFKLGGRSLGLAVFGACQSAAAAACFVAGGAGAAIGFEQDVPIEASRYLTAPVVGAALRSHGDPEAIRQAFRAGYAALQARGLSGMEPTAYFAE